MSRPQSDDVDVILSEAVFDVGLYAFDPWRTSLREVAALVHEIAARKPPPSVK